MSIGKLRSVTAQSDLTLFVEWDDSFTARLDLWPIVSTRSVLAELKAPDEFGRAALSDDRWSLEWPCGIDFGASQLRRWATHGFETSAAA